jgi:hypothetical protein
MGECGPVPRHCSFSGLESRRFRNVSTDPLLEPPSSGQWILKKRWEATRPERNFIATKGMNIESPEVNSVATRVGVLIARGVGIYCGDGLYVRSAV